METADKIKRRNAVKKLFRLNITKSKHITIPTAENIKVNAWVLELAIVLYMVKPIGIPKRGIHIKLKILLFSFLMVSGSLSIYV